MSNYNPTSYNSRYATDPFYGLVSYGDAFQLDGSPAAPGFANRKRGDHPPEPPISNREKQTMDQYARVRAKYESAPHVPVAIRESILRANENVVAALRDSSQLLGARTYHRCLRYSRGDASWSMRADYRLGRCGRWDDTLRRADETLAVELRKAEPYDAEAARLAAVSESLKDQSETAMEAAEDVTTPGGTKGSWWDNTPKWVKTLAYASGGLLVARVMVPPLFDTYLTARRRD